MVLFADPGDSLSNKIEAIQIRASHPDVECFDWLSQWRR